MSWRSPAWGVLGIDPTSDQTAIRRAYATRLKMIDADREPQAFIELREAFEQARNEAAWSDFDDEEHADEPAEAPDAVARPVEIDFDLIDWPETLPEPEPVRGPWASPRPEDIDARAEALFRLVDRPEEAPTWATPEETETMLAHWRALSADPRLHEVGRFADAEQWFAWLVSAHSPFSDPLVVPVSDFFGWMASEGEISQPPAIAFVAHRRRALVFANTVSRSGHPLHAAWVELTTPAHEGSRRGRGVRRSDVERLLETVRRDVPEVEGNFDGYRVSLWAKRKERGCLAQVAWTIFVIIALNLVRLGCSPQHTPAPAPVVIQTKLENPRVDTDRALESLFGDKLDVATVEAENPDLAQALNRQWLADRGAGVTLADYADSIRTLLDTRYRDGLANASVELLRERQRYALSEVELLRSFGAEICADILQGKSLKTGTPVPPALEAQRKVLVARVLLETRPSAKPRPREARFRVPPDVVTATAKRAGMDREDLLRALRFEGPAQAQCNGRIALMETVLALPAKRAEPLLRQM